jgi:hypothetical protein
MAPLGEPQRSRTDLEAARPGHQLHQPGALSWGCRLSDIPHVGKVTSFEPGTASAQTYGYPTGLLQDMPVAREQSYVALGSGVQCPADSHSPSATRRKRVWSRSRCWERPWQVVGSLCFHAVYRIRRSSSLSPLAPCTWSHYPTPHSSRVVSTRAWAWLASDAGDLADKVRCLQATVALDPALDWAHAALKDLQYRLQGEN